MKTVWTDHLKTEEEKDKFRNYVKGSKDLLERLRDILVNRLKAVEASETNVKGYESPSWAFLQAHRNGSRAELNAILNLINLDQQRDDNERNLTR